MSAALAYEYRQITCEHNDACTELNKLGLEGWKLIPSTVKIASGEHPTENRRMTSLSGLMERTRDAAEVKKEKADAEAKAKKDADEAKAKVDKEAADKAKAVADKAAAAKVPAAPTGVPAAGAAGAKP